MRILAFDTETLGLDWFDPDQQAFLLSWAETDDFGQVCTVGRAGDEASGIAEFMEAVKRCDVLAAHNLPFDIHQVRETLGIDLLAAGKELIDTNILSRVAVPERLNIGAGYKLKDLALTYLDPDAKDPEEAIEALAKSIGLRTLKKTGAYYETWRAYPAEMETYAIKDAEYVRDLVPLLLDMLTDHTSKCWKVEQAVQPHLIRAEQRGVRVNPAIVEQLRAEYEPLARDAEARTMKVMGDINLASHEQLRDRLVELGVPLYRLTEGKQLSTAAFALAEFEDKFPFLKDLAEWRAADKMLSTYIEPMTGREIVHTSFWQVGARTGRMSCSRPNMQNLPARSEAGDTKLREVFVPRPGYCFVVCDYESIEVKLLAYYLNDKAFQAKIEAGFGVFEWLASCVWGGEPEDYAKGTPGEGRRSDAKNVTYAILYGAGIKRVADMLACHRDEAKRIIGLLKRALPGYLSLANTWNPKGRIPRKIEATGFLTTIMGRRQCIGRDDKGRYRNYLGLNALIQGSAADIFKQGVINAVEATAIYDAHPVLFVHDELVLECPVVNGEEVLHLANLAMCEAFELSPRLEVSGSVCIHNYAEGK